MGEQVSYSYPCHNHGCSNGHMSSFEAAPPDWFAEKGLSAPKNCPDCRAWAKDQTDTEYRCKSCSRRIRQTAKAKISHHKHKGVYEAPEQCNRCREGVAPQKTVGEEDRPPELDETGCEVLDIVPYDKLSEYRREHYGKHIPGHPFSEVGQPMRSGDLVSATSLVGAEASSVELYYAASSIAGLTRGAYQYMSGTNVIKATVVDDTHMELTVFRPVGDGSYEFVTSYDEVPIIEVQRNINNERR